MVRETFFRVATAMGVKKLPEPFKRRLRPIVGLKNPSQRVRYVTVADEGVLDDLSSEIIEAARRGGIHVFEGGTSAAATRRLNVSVKAALAFNRIVRRVCEAKEGISPLGRGGRPISFDRLCQPYTDAYDLVYLRHRRRERFISRLEVSFWSEVGTYNGAPKITPDRQNQDVYIAEDFRSLAAAYPAVAAALSEFGSPARYSFPIDAVITWVDDTDEKWAEEKDQWLTKAGKVANAVSRAHLSERFRNRDELRYCLRSLDMFAPYFRTIYLVTADQKPEWLRTDNPRLKLVSHSEIFKSQKALPTFNSHAIETQLHHIEGLAEHFVYFNDDVFLGRYSHPSDFFLPNGILKYRPSPNTVVPEVQTNDQEEYMAADLKVVNLFRERFNYSPRNVMEHVPCVLRRSFLFELEKEFQEQFDLCAAQKFRSEKDITPTSFMLPHYAAYRGSAIPEQSESRYLALWKPTIDAQFRSVLRARKHKFFCINDVGLPEGMEADIDKLVTNFLEAYFPIASQFEASAPEGSSTSDAASVLSEDESDTVT